MVAKINSKRGKYLNVRAKTIKFLEQRLNLCDLGLTNKIMTQKA